MIGTRMQKADASPRKQKICRGEDIAIDSDQRGSARRKRGTKAEGKVVRVASVGELVNVRANVR
jgi:hypothetical protein